MVLTFKTKVDGTLTLHTNNTLIKNFASKLESVVNKFFLEDVKDNEFIITNYVHKFDFIVVTIKHRNENILTYFKKLQAKSVLENLFWDFDDYNAIIKYKRYRNKDELRLAKAKLKEVLHKAKKIKNEFPNVYQEKKAELEERLAV